MTLRQPKPPHHFLERAVRSILPDAQVILRPPRRRLLPEAVLWRELVACILGSRVPSELAAAATRELVQAGLLDLPVPSEQLGDFEGAVASLLARPIFPPATRSGIGRRYTYYRLRAHHISLTARRIYLSGISLTDLLHVRLPPQAIRKSIAAIAVGVGPKQASLFLTNVGYTCDLAILDTHVIAFMRECRMLEGTPCLSSFAGYTSVEARLRVYADSLGASLAALDLAIWTVMREYTEWKRR